MENGEVGKEMCHVDEWDFLFPRSFLIKNDEGVVLEVFESRVLLTLQSLQYSEEHR